MLDLGLIIIIDLLCIFSDDNMMPTFLKLFMGLMSIE